MAKRAVLGRGIDSIFDITIPVPKPAGNKAEIREFVKVSNQPKFKTFDVKLSILLRQDQLDWLSLMERKIMKSRSSRNKKERITKNSIIRACLDLINDLDIDVREIADETELLNRLQHALFQEKTA
ncbi:MAG: hypothetical protein QME49_07720 [bacterium]|nr:hypothetical protein [bacterium]